MDVTWLVMPVTYSDSWSPRPKYPIDDDAVVIYRNRRAYVGLRTASPEVGLSSHSDVHEITATQVEQLQASSVMNLGDAANHVLAQGDHRFGNRTIRAAHRVGLGDVVALVTRRLGLTECPSCTRRRKGLNRIRMPRFVRPDPS